MYVVYTVFYHYFFRCPSYAQIPTSCHMEADPNDPCCRKPVCHYDPITGHTYIPIPAFAPAVTGKGVVEPPTSSDLLNNTQYTATVALFQTGFTPVPPTVQSNITGGIGRSRWRIVGKIAIFFFWHETWHFVDICVSVSTGYCVYKGKQYTQSQRWDDGCAFTCVCEDSRIGKYRCFEKWACTFIIIFALMLTYAW